MKLVIVESLCATPGCSESQFI